MRRLPALPCCAPGISTLRLWRFPALRSGEGGEGMALGGGGPRNPAGSGCLGESGVLRPRGYGSACSAAGEWARTTAEERAEAGGRGWVRDFSGNSTMVRLVAFLCRSFRQISAALSSASLLFLTAYPSGAFRRFHAVPQTIHATPCGASLRFGSGWSRGAAGGFGVSWGIRGVAGLRAWESLWRGRGVGGARSMEWVRFFSVDSTRLCLPVLPCCASRHIHVAPSALPCPSVRGRWRWCGAVRYPGWLWGSGRRGLAGMGTPAAQQGSGRGPWQGSGWGAVA